MKKRDFWFLISAEIVMITFCLIGTGIGIFNIIGNNTINLYQVIIFPLIGAFAIWQTYSIIKLYKKKKD